MPAYAAEAFGRTDWNTVAADSFSGPSSFVRLGITNDEFARAVTSIANGKLELDIQAWRDMLWTVGGASTTHSRFLLTVTTQLVKGPTTTVTGLTFKRGDRGYYLVAIDNTRRLDFGLNYEGRWTDLLGPTTVAEIQPGGENALTVLVDGSAICIFVNRQFVAEANDSRLISGYTGVNVEMAGGDQATVYFDDYRLLEQ